MKFGKSDLAIMEKIAECTALLAKQMGVEGFVFISARADGYASVDCENVRLYKVEDGQEFLCEFKNTGYQE